MAETLIGLYDDLVAAQNTIHELLNVGIGRERIRLFATSVWSNAATSSSILPTDYLPEGQWSTMQDLPAHLNTVNISPTETSIYAEAVRRGGILLVVSTTEHEVTQATEIMQSFNPLNIDQRAAQWQASGWITFQPENAPYTEDLILQEQERFRTGTFQEGMATLPVVEEELVVGKQQVSQGGVRIHSYVTERPVEQNVELRTERVTVERRPVDWTISPDAPEAFQESTMEVHTTAEEAVVTKQAHVIEEVVVHKDVEAHTETVHESVRRTDVEVEQLEAQPAREGRDILLSPEKSFYFRGPEYRLNMAASTLRDFSRFLGQVDDETWLYHLRRGDYTRWFRTTLQDEALAAESERLEHQAEITPEEGRTQLRVAIEQHYAGVS